MTTGGCYDSFDDMQRTNAAKYVLIAALAFLFIWFGVDKLIHPNTWIGWMPTWMDGLLGFEIGMWLSVVGVIEFVLGVLLLIPVRKVRIVATAIIILHLAFVVFQVGWNDIGIRDVALLGSAVSLLLLLL